MIDNIIFNCRPQLEVIKSPPTNFRNEDQHMREIILRTKEEIRDEVTEHVKGAQFWFKEQWRMTHDPEEIIAAIRDWLEEKGDEGSEESEERRYERMRTRSNNDYKDTIKTYRRGITEGSRNMAQDILSNGGKMASEMRISIELFKIIRSGKLILGRLGLDNGATDGNDDETNSALYTRLIVGHRKAYEFVLIRQLQKLIRAGQRILRIYANRRKESAIMPSSILKTTSKEDEPMSIFAKRVIKDCTKMIKMVNLLSRVSLPTEDGDPNPIRPMPFTQTIGLTDEVEKGIQKILRTGKDVIRVISNQISHSDNGTITSSIFGVTTTTDDDGIFQELKEANDTVITRYMQTILRAGKKIARILEARKDPLRRSSDEEESEESSEEESEESNEEESEESSEEESKESSEEDSEESSEEDSEESSEEDSEESSQEESEESDEEESEENSEEDSEESWEGRKPYKYSGTEKTYDEYGNLIGVNSNNIIDFSKEARNINKVCEDILKRMRPPKNAKGVATKHNLSMDLQRIIRSAKKMARHLRYNPRHFSHSGDYDYPIMSSSISSTTNEDGQKIVSMTNDMTLSRDVQRIIGNGEIILDILRTGISRQSGKIVVTPSVIIVARAQDILTASKSILQRNNRNYGKLPSTIFRRVKDIMRDGQSILKVLQSNEYLTSENNQGNVSPVIARTEGIVKRARMIRAMLKPQSNYHFRSNKLLL